MTVDLELRVEHSTKIVKSPRVLQCASMFDVPVEEKNHREWDVRMPLSERPWNIGLIVGPSGAGKTSIARAAFGDDLVTSFSWSPDRALLDDFPAMPIKELIGLLSAVGFSSPPSWMLPFTCLSNGEQFRVMCARALAEAKGLVAIDEFTSVVDRQVAQVASHTVQKTVRKTDRQLVAISCHYDIVDWLQPDWVYQPHTGEFTWRSVQSRPRADLVISSVHRSAWRAFAPHHYLTPDILASAKCFGAWVGDECVAFNAIRMFPHPTTKNIWFDHRLVVLPDWQGLGIGPIFNDWTGQYLYERKYRYRIATGHPAMISACARSPRWREILKSGPAQSSVKARASLAKAQADPRRMLTRTFEYAPPKET
jgi:GNAT superfamily N-acetyltransferase